MTVGQTHALIVQLIEKRTKGNPGLTHFVRAQLVMKGINPDVHSPTSSDDARVVDMLRQMIRNFES